MTKPNALVFILFFSLIFFSCFSQKNYSPAYIVKVNGDTIHGLIKYRAWDKNPKRISFVAQAGAEEYVYDAGSIRSFFVANEYYESAIVDVDTSPVKIHEINENKEPQFVRDTVFLQSLFRGEKSLLYLKDQSAIEHFFIYDDGYKPLIYKKYKQMVRSLGVWTKQLMENLEYKRQLFFYLNNCPDIQQKIESSRHESRSLTNLFASYHECINKSVKYSNTRAALDVEKGLLVGAVGTEIQFEGVEYIFFYVLKSKYDRSVTPSVGLFLNARLLRSKGLKISNDLFYTFFKINGAGTSDLGTNLESRFSYHYLKMHNLIRLNLLKNGSLQLAAGPSSAAVIKKENYIKVGQGDQEFASRNYEFGAVGALGIELGKVAVDVRYERAMGFSRYTELDAKSRRIYLILKYRLN